MHNFLVLLKYFSTWKNICLPARRIVLSLHAHYSRFSAPARCCSDPKERGKLVFKRFIRWTLPLIVLMLIAMYLVFSPVLASHAATPATNQQAPHVIQLHSHGDQKQQDQAPNMFCRP